MRPLFPAIAALSLGWMLATPAAAVVTSDYVCWMETQAGAIVDLSALCGGAPAAARTTPSSNAESRFLAYLRGWLPTQPFGAAIVGFIDDGTLDPIGTAQNYCDRRRGGQSDADILADYGRALAQSSDALATEIMTTYLANISLIGPRFFCVEFSDRAN